MLRAPERRQITPVFARCSARLQRPETLCRVLPRRDQVPDNLTDMITLARNRVMCDAVLLSGDEDNQTFALASNNHSSLGFESYTPIKTTISC